MTNKELGKWGEALACQYLVSQGYAIVKQNWKMNHLEVDIIASKDNTLVFVEVKTRSDADADPVEAVNRRKRQRTIGAADVYMRTAPAGLEYRFDIVSVVGEPGNAKIEHIPDAFVPPLKRYNYSFKM